jgi:hypothetical protein
MMAGMERFVYRLRGTVLAAGVALAAFSSTWAQAPDATAEFSKYVQKVEERLAREHRTEETILAPVDLVRLRKGDRVIEKLTPSDTDLPGAMLHDWRGSAFAPGAKVADFERLMRSFPAYAKVYAPQVSRARVNSHDGDHYDVTMRVVQKHVLTVVMDTSYDVSFVRPDGQRGYSISRSTTIAEIDAPGTMKERALPSGQDHGFLWRLNTYWTYEERDGGLYMQIESVSLTRSIPIGLGWAVGPFVESVPRESLEFTLRKTCEALKK